MGPSPDLDRRFVLRALACLVPTWACAARGEPSVAPEALVSAGVPSALAEVGRRYLELRPEEGDAEALRTAMGLHGARTHDELLARLEGSLREDLDRDRMVSLDGWALPRTEARLYALLALS